MGNKWAKLDFNWIFSSFDLFLTTVYIIFNIEYKYVYRIPKGPYLDYSYNSVWLLYWLWWDALRKRLRVKFNIYGTTFCWSEISVYTR